MTKPHYLTTKQLMSRYSVCRRTIARWSENTSLNFPQAIQINHRRYWRVDEVEIWEGERQNAATTSD